MRSSTCSRTRARFQGPVLLHVRTVKGKGFEPAESDARTFHGVGPNVYSPDEGRLEKKSGRADVRAGVRRCADRRCRARRARHRHHRRDARRHRPREVREGVSGALFRRRHRRSARGVFRRRRVDERTSSRSCAIYSTFLQRAYDQIVHDVAIQNLPVVFALDRAGFVGDDGPTHMGLYDIAYLRTLPNMVLMAPRNEAEIAPMLDLALAHRRAGRDALSARQLERQVGRAAGAARRSAAPKCCAAAAASRSSRSATRSTPRSTPTTLLDDDAKPTVVNMRFVKPLDENLILELAETHTRFITLEEHALAGGFGSAVVEFVNDRGLDDPGRTHRRAERARPPRQARGPARPVRADRRTRRGPGNRPARQGSSGRRGVVDGLILPFFPRSLNSSC